MQPEWRQAVDAASLAERTGCQAIVGVGDSQVIEMSKAVAMLAHSNARDPKGCFWKVERGSVRARKPNNYLCPPESGRHLALATVPTIPAGGLETSGTLRVMDWDEEARLVLMDPVAEPDVVCIDAKMMLQDNSKAAHGPAVPTWALTWALGNTLCIAQEMARQGKNGFDASGVLREIATAYRLKSSDEEASYLALGKASVVLGDWYHILFPYPDESAPPHHIHTALALCDNLPARYDSAAASILEAAANRWWQAEDWRVADALLSEAGLERSHLGFATCPQSDPGPEYQDIVKEVAGYIDLPGAQSVLQASLFPRESGEK